MRRFHFFAPRLGASMTERRFKSREEAALFLRKQVEHPDVRNDLRLWHARRGHTACSDRELLEYSAAHLVTGEMRYSKRVALHRVSAGVIDETEGEVDPVKPGERVTPSAMRKPQPKSSAQTDQPKPKVDPNQQAATLVAAAKSGAPFCEICAQSNSEAAQ